MSEESKISESIQSEELHDAEQTDTQEVQDGGLPIRFEPEDVQLNYPGFRVPKTEAQIHYELASLDVLIKSLETRKAKLQRDWTHYKLTVHLNAQAMNQAEQGQE